MQTSGSVWTVTIRMTPELEARLRAASIEERNRAIVDAHHAGASLRAIAKILGMTHGGIRYIIIDQRNQTP